jgi:hypothetical protein
MALETCESRSDNAPAIYLNAERCQREKPFDKQFVTSRISWFSNRERQRQVPAKDSCCIRPDGVFEVAPPQRRRSGRSTGSTPCRWPVSVSETSSSRRPSLSVAPPGHPTAAGRMRVSEDAKRYRSNAASEDSQPTIRSRTSLMVPALHRRAWQIDIESRFRRNSLSTPEDRPI